GHYDALVGRMGRAFHERRMTMDKAVEDTGLTVAGSGSFGGSALWMRAPEHIDTRDLAQRLSEKGVLIEPGQAFFSGPDVPSNYYRLAYSSIPSKRIADGVEILARTLREMG
nr:GntR family transcriptional regulator [Octadecabacter sp.]